MLQEHQEEIKDLRKMLKEKELLLEELQKEYQAKMEVLMSESNPLNFDKVSLCLIFMFSLWSYCHIFDDIKVCNDCIVETT